MTETREFNHSDGVSLEKHFNSRLKSLEEKIEMQFRLNQEAINKAEITMNSRLESMNEFRAQMKDQTAGFVTRQEFELNRKLSDAGLHSLEISKATLEGKADQSSVNRASIIAFISALFGAAGFIFGLLNVLGG